MDRSRDGSPSLRQLRVGEELRHAMVRVLGHAHFNDPVLAQNSITVTEVKVSPDLKNAVVFVTPLGGAALEDTVASLNRAAGLLRGQLGREISLRHTPQLAFAADRSFDHAVRMQDLLEQPRVRRDLSAAEGEADHGATEEITPSAGERGDGA